jgi:radical SAM protein with 4Fe4S-binding SPASM domain
MLNLLGPSGVGCKCTYTHQTISDWFNGIKFLVDLGVDKINANNVSDESWPKEEAPILFDQFTKMVDYLFEKDLYDKVNIQQISSGRVNEMINFNLTDKVFNKKCIVCKSISTNYCLGVDNLIYPCHRFAATLNKNFSYGYLQNGSVIVTNQKLIDQINSFCGLENMSETCNKCDLKNMCYDCSEQYFIMNPEDPMFERNQRTSPLCAWTIASAGAKLYFKRVLRSCLNISEDAPDDIQLLKKQSEVK